jgi:LacI family transcriptional regulator
MTDHKPVTRTDVARYAGVSSAVVSYVLNDGPKPVAPATRQRVLDAVALLEYRPNATARALSRGKVDMIGMIVPDIRNPYFSELVYAVDLAAHARGRTLLVINSDVRRTAAPHHLKGLVSQQFDGLVVADTLSAAETALIVRLNIPIVLINQFRGAEDFMSIGVDYLDGAKKATEHLIARGHRKIAFIGGTNPALDPREHGWMDALTEAGLPLGRRYRAEFTSTGGYQAALELSRDPDRPSAVFIASDQLAIAALAAFHAAGLRIPEDIAVISFDGTTESQYSWPPLTTMVQPVRAMADEAIDRLLAGSPKPMFVAYPMKIVLRASSGD